MIIAYCIKCGNKFPQEAVFCPYCGTKVYRPESETATRIEEHVETATESTIVKVVEETEPVNDKVKDFHERLINAVAAKGECLQTLPKEEKTPDPSPEPVKVDCESVVEPTTETLTSTPQSIKPNVENVAGDGSSNVEEELEDPSTGGCIIAFFFPMIGFISAICNIGSNKKKAKRYALLATAGLLVGFISGVIQAL